MYAATANGAVAGAAATTIPNVAANAANTTGTTTMMSDDDLRALTDDAHTIRCCGCGETLYDDGRYDCRCTNETGETTNGH